MVHPQTPFSLSLSTSLKIWDSGGPRAGPLAVRGWPTLVRTAPDPAETQLRASNAPVLAFLRFLFSSFRVHQPPRYLPDNSPVAPWWLQVTALERSAGKHQPGERLLRLFRFLCHPQSPLPSRLSSADVQWLAGSWRMVKPSPASGPSHRLP